MQKKISFYHPSDDSFLLCDVVEKYLRKFSSLELEKMKVIDMGTGSGIQSMNCLNFGIKKENLIAIDSNISAIKHVKILGLNAIKSDLFSNLKESKIKEKFDLIIFNPPYLPEHKYDKKKDTTGGKKGDETIIRFIKQLKSHLSKKGVCFLLTSSITPEKIWQFETKKQGFKIKQVAKKTIFYEDLFVWEIKN
ncbi:MAG TPA: methyltransferase [Candidatus Paceibacterota bacterium]|nr:methyltransferase [Candidatus Paceibacterota bacterium]